MFRAEITNADASVIVEALAFTIEALRWLPIGTRPDNNTERMEKLIYELVCSDASLLRSQAIARHELEYVMKHLRLASRI